MQLGGYSSWEIQDALSDGVRVSTRNSLALQFDGLFYEYQKVMPQSVTATSYYSPSYSPSNVIDNKATIGTSWASWYSKKTPSSFFPEVLVFDFGPGGASFDTFRWHYLDNFENRQPYTYSLSFSNDGLLWNPVANLTNGVVDPEGSLIIEKALKSDLSPADLSGNTIDGNYNNAVDHSQPRWVSHGFSRIIARYFRMSIAQSGGGQVVKNNKTLGGFVGVTEAQFYFLGEVLDGVSSYTPEGFYESEVVSLGRVERFVTYYSQPDQTTVQTFYRTCPITDNLLLSPWVEIINPRDFVLPYTPTELILDDWLFQVKFVLKTDNILITPEVFWVELVIRSQNLIESYTILKSDDFRQDARFEKGSLLHSLPAELSRSELASITQLHHEELYAMQTYLHSLFSRMYHLHHIHLETRDKFDANTVDTSITYDTRSIDTFQVLLAEMLETRMSYRADRIEYLNELLVRMISHVENLYANKIEKVYLQTLVQLEERHQIDPRALTSLYDALVRPLLSAHDVEVKPLLGVYDQIVTRLIGLHNVDPKVLIGLIDSPVKSLVVGHDIFVPLMTGALSCPVIPIIGAQSYALTPLYTPTDFKLTHLLNRYDVSIKSLPGVVDFSSVSLYGYSPQTVGALDHYYDFQSTDLVNATSLGIGQLVYSQDYSLAQLKGFIDRSVELLSQMLQDVRMRTLVKPFDLQIHDAALGGTFLNFSARVNEYFNMAVNSRPEFLSLGIGVLDEATNVAGGVKALTQDFACLLPSVSKAFFIYNSEKISLLPVQPVTKEIKNSFSVWTRRGMPNTDLPPTLMTILCNTRELESPPISEGGLGVILRYPYMPESWEGISHIGLLQEHTRTDVKTFKGNITVDWEAVVQDVVVTEKWTAMDYNFYHQLWIFYMQRKHLKYRPKDLNNFEYVVEIIEIKAQKQHRFWVNGVELKMKIHALGGSWCDPLSECADDYKTDGSKDPYNGECSNEIFPDHIDEINERVDDAGLA